MDHLPAKIIILVVCWSSDAFLVYIQPQVLEWTHNMSWDIHPPQLVLQCYPPRYCCPRWSLNPQTPQCLLRWPRLSRDYSKVLQTSLIVQWWGHPRIVGIPSLASAFSKKQTTVLKLYQFWLWVGYGEAKSIKDRWILEPALCQVLCEYLLVMSVPSTGDWAKVFRFI
jgi:hypothetical protein